jgi:predicted esterase
MDIHTLAAQAHGRYLVESPKDQVAGMLCGFHGYKENAEIHLDVLGRIAGDRPWRLVSVQALNRFYSKGGGIVASWMTRQDRDHAIADNVAYVAAVLSEVAGEYGTARPIVYAGFSQGVAMAYRSAVFAGRPCDGLIVLAGDVPPDVAPVAGQLPRTLLGRGTNDEFYTGAKAALDRAVLRHADVDVVEHVFEGGHAWDESFFARAGEFLDELILARTA